MKSIPKLIRENPLPLIAFAIMGMLLFNAGKAAAEDEYSDAVTSKWSELVKRYNSEMTNPDKVIGMSLSSSMEMGPTMSHKRAAWYYGRVNFLLGKYSVQPTKEREKAVLDAIDEFLSKYNQSTNTPAVKP